MFEILALTGLGIAGVGIYRAFFRKRNQDTPAPRQLTGSMHSRYPECGNANRAARRGNKSSYRMRFDRSGSAHSNASTFRFGGACDNRYIR